MTPAPGILGDARPALAGLVAVDSARAAAHPCVPWLRVTPSVAIATHLLTRYAYW